MTTIREYVQTASAERQSAYRRRALLLAGSAAFIGLGVLALLDHWFILTRPIRWLGWGAVLVAVAWPILLHQKRRRPAHLERIVAHAIEEQAGEAAPLVATAIDENVRREGESAPLNRLLLEYLDRRAEQTVQAVPRRFGVELRRPAAWFAVAFAGVALIALLGGGYSLLRVALPWHALPHTRVTLQGPQQPLAEGRPFELTGRIDGRPVNKVALTRSDRSNPPPPVQPAADGSFTIRIAGLTGRTSFQALAGDGWSSPVTIEPYALPAITGFQVEVIPPAYASRLTSEESSGSFSVLRGSRLRYRFRVNQPIQEARFLVSPSRYQEEPASPQELEQGRSPFRFATIGARRQTNDPGPSAQSPVFEPPLLEPSADDPQLWQAAIDPLSSSLLYRIELRGTRDDLVRNDEPFRITVLPDAAPKARITGHNADEVVRQGDEDVQFRLRVTDDVGVSQVELVYRKPGSTHQRLVVPLPAAAPREFNVQQLLALAPLELKPLDLVAVHAEASDANTLDGPGIGRSDVVFIEIPEPPAAAGGAGGGGGGGGQQVNILEVQKEILQSTIRLPDEAVGREFAALHTDQAQNREYTDLLAGSLADQTLSWDYTGPPTGAAELRALLQSASGHMEGAASKLAEQDRAGAVPLEEAALGQLIEAAKWIAAQGGSGEFPGQGAGGTTITLRSSSQGNASSPSQAERQNQEAIRQMAAELARQLREQQALNQQVAAGQSQAQASSGPGSPGAAGQNGGAAIPGARITAEDLLRASARQMQLSEDAARAAAAAGDLKAPPGSGGDPQALAEELQRAASGQDEAARALAARELDQAARLGGLSATALAEAIKELELLLANLRFAGAEGESYPVGYEKLVEDYLRTISYE